MNHAVLRGRLYELYKLYKLDKLSNFMNFTNRNAWNDNYRYNKFGDNTANFCMIA
jgi:hypothetical protein